MTSAIVTVEVPPFLSVRTSLPPCIIAVIVPPSTVVSMALPPPELHPKGDQRQLLSNWPLQGLVTSHGEADAGNPCPADGASASPRAKVYHRLEFMVD